MDWVESGIFDPEKPLTEGACRVTGRVGSDTAWVGSGQITGSRSRVGSRLLRVGSGPNNWTREQLCCRRLKALFGSEDPQNGVILV